MPIRLAAIQLQERSLAEARSGRFPGVPTADVDPARPLLKHDFSRTGENRFRPRASADRRPET